MMQIELPDNWPHWVTALLLLFGGMAGWMIRAFSVVRALTKFETGIRADVDAIRQELQSHEAREEADIHGLHEEIRYVRNRLDAHLDKPREP